LRGGGGGGLGAVTALTMAVRPAPTVHTFYYEWGLDVAADVLDAWQRWVAGVDSRAWSTCKLLATPGDGSARSTISGTWIGPASGLDGVLAPLLSKLGPPRDSARYTMSYGQAMAFEAGCYGRDAASCTKAALAPPRRQAFAGTSSIVPQPLPTGAVEAAVASTRAALDLSGAIEAGVSFDVLGGAVATVAPEATAFPHRHALATVQYTATWKSGSAAPFDAYVRGFRTTMTPWLGGAAYVNYADASIVDFGQAYWADNYPRLRAVKRAVDPDDLFSFPQSPRP
jgi:FAD/FMN-containing dehydrogenase